MTMVFEPLRATPHELAGSLDELLSPATMGRIEGRKVTCVHAEPWAVSANTASGSLFMRAKSQGDDGTRRHDVIKRTSRARDIIMRLTGDTACREMVVWQRGLLDCLPSEVMHPMVGAAVDSDGWALLMHDVSDALPPYTRWPREGWQPATSEQTRNDARWIGCSTRTVLES